MEVSSKIALGDPYIWGNDCEDALDDLDGTSGNRNPSCSFEILGEGHNANHGAMCIFRTRGALSRLQTTFWHCSLTLETTKKRLVTC